MEERDAQLLDIFAPAPEPPPRSGWLTWGAVAGAVAFAGLAVAAAVWSMAPSRGYGVAGVPASTAPASPPSSAAPSPPEHAPGGPFGGPTDVPDDPEAAPPASRALADLMAELPASWRAGTPLTLPEADPWTMPDLPFLVPLAPLASPLDEPEAPAAPPAVARAPPRPAAVPLPAAVPNQARPPASARTARAPPSEPTGNAARCREAVAAAQIGEDLSGTTLALMRARCAE